jgi:hypothetical protein
VDTTGSNGRSQAGDITNAIETARRGLRRDVQVLIDALEDGELYVPLARSIPDTDYGERMEIGGDLELSPHLLVDEDERPYCAVFSRAELLEPVGEELGWTTDGGPLEYCALPAPIVFDMTLSVIDEETVFGLVFNAMSGSELVLRRDEAASIAQGKAVPLVGYVQEIPPQEFEETLVAEGDPPPEELVQAIERCVAGIDGIKGYRLERTFNAERDLEPHLTLTLGTDPGDLDFADISRRVVAEIEDKLPPPGYIDILFDEAPN